MRLIRLLGFLIAALLALPALAQEADPVAKLRQDWQALEVMHGHASEAALELVKRYQALSSEVAELRKEKLWRDGELGSWAAQVQGYQDRIAAPENQ